MHFPLALPRALVPRAPGLAGEQVAALFGTWQ